MLPCRSAEILRGFACLLVAAAVYFYVAVHEYRHADLFAHKNPEEVSNGP